MERVRGRSTLGYLMVTGAACLWGTLGVVSRGLYDGGLSAQAVVTVRAGAAAALLLAAMLLLRPRAVASACGTSRSSRPTGWSASPLSTCCTS